MAWGLTSTGFEAPSLADILEEKEESYKSTYGDDFQAIDTNIIWQNAVIEAERELYTWQMMESVYYSQTMDGSEGIYLDNVLGQQGVYRNDETSGSGYAVIASNSSIAGSDTVSTSTVFSASNGITYTVDVETSHRERMVGMYVTMDDFDASTLDIDFYLVGTDSGNTTHISDEIDTSDNESVSDLFATIAASIIDDSDNTDDDVFVVNNDTDDVALCIGYSEDGELSGISDPMEMYFSTEYGIKAASFYVTADEAGYNQLETGGISSVSPTSSNYEEVTNTESFSSGSDVETDTEYRARYDQVKDTASAGTRTAVLSEVLDVDDVESAIIYDNATSEDTDYADAFTFKVVVTGGETEDIAQAIFDTKPVNAGTSGTVSYSVDTDDGSTETIYFSRTTEVILDIIIEYSTTTGISLASDEQEDIEEGIEEIIDAISVGGTIFNAQIAGAVFTALDSGRLTALTVYMKDSTEDDDEYSTSNFELGSEEVASTSEDNIIHSKV